MHLDKVDPLVDVASKGESMDQVVSQIIGSSVISFLIFTNFTQGFLPSFHKEFPNIGSFPLTAAGFIMVTFLKGSPRSLPPFKNDHIFQFYKLHGLQTFESYKLLAAILATGV